MTNLIDVVDSTGVEPDKDLAPAAKGLSTEELAAELLARAGGDPIRLVGPGGLLGDLTKKVLEAALEAEMTEHVGYEPYDPAGHHSGNSRNGTRQKTVITDIGPVEIDVPRDRAGTFSPVMVPKRRRRLGGVDQMVLSLSAKGLTHGEISAHLEEIYGAKVSKETVTRITDSVLETRAQAKAAINAWIKRYNAVRLSHGLLARQRPADRVGAQLPSVRASASRIATCPVRGGKPKQSR